MIVDILIAQGNPDDALANQRRQAVLHLALVASVPETAGHPLDQADHPLRVPQQKRAGIRSDHPTVKGGHHTTPFKAFKFELFWDTLCLHRLSSGIRVIV